MDKTELHRLVTEQVNRLETALDCVKQGYEPSNDLGNLSLAMIADLFCLYHMVLKDQMSQAHLLLTGLGVDSNESRVIPNKIWNAIEK